MASAQLEFQDIDRHDTGDRVGGYYDPSEPQ
jgi:hypothetical protein